MNRGEPQVKWIQMHIMLRLIQSEAYVSELSRELGYPRKKLKAHLEHLEKQGYVSRRYEISKDIKGRAVLKYQTTDKAVYEISKLKEQMK